MNSAHHHFGGDMRRVLVVVEGRFASRLVFRAIAAKVNSSYAPSLIQINRLGIDHHMILASPPRRPAA